MSLPETVRVKISSEAASTIALSPVVAQEMPLRELMRLVLAATGKDAGRVQHLLASGQFVSGQSRLRWDGLDMDMTDVAMLLNFYPDPDPVRPFSPAKCHTAILRGPGALLRVTREIAAKRPLLRPRSFWDSLISLASLQNPEYVTYSYRESADVYRLALVPDEAERLRQSARLLRSRGLSLQIRQSSLDSLEYLVPRD